MAISTAAGSKNLALTQAGDDFIVTCKQTSHKALYDFIDGAEPERHVETIRKGKAVETRRYRWIEGVPLRDGRDAALVNWVACEIIDRHGAVKYSVAWVTSLPGRQSQRRRHRRLWPVTLEDRERNLQRDEKSRL